jgi:hypothetical protein
MSSEKFPFQAYNMLSLHTLKMITLLRFLLLKDFLTKYLVLHPPQDVVVPESIAFCYIAAMLTQPPSKQNRI